MTSSPTGVSAVDAVLLLVLIAGNGIGVAGIIVVSRVGCVAGAGGTVDSISNSSSRKVAIVSIVVSRVGCVAGAGGTVDSISNSSSRKVAIVSISIVSRSSCGKESKFSLPLNCGMQRQLTNGVYSAFHTTFDQWFPKFV